MASRKAFLPADASLNMLVGINEKLVKEADKTANTTASSVKYLMIGAILLSVILSLGLGIVLSRNMAGIIKSLSSETKSLTDAALAGKLETRGNLEKINFEFRDVVDGINKTLDAVIGPLNVAANYVDRISKGDIPPKITDSYNGDFNVIKDNLNNCIDNINALVADADMVAKAAVEGNLDIRSDASKHQGDFRRIVAGVNETIESLVGHLDSVPAPALIIGTDFSISYINQTGADLIGLTKQQLMGTKCYNHFKTSDCNTAKCACGRAMQDDRKCTSETDAHPGKYNLEISYTGVPVKDRQGKIIGALEIVTDQTAVKQAAHISEKISRYQQIEVAKVTETLGRIAKGDLSVKLQAAEADQDTAAVKANFENISGAVAESVQAINNLVTDADMLVKAAVEGKLTTRADASKHQGDFRKIVDGVNNT
ncbi:MAG: PAS domain-containing protein, partial [Deltaproteobacteria bacterium]|nr:PAS domain-containing protein [Deltaproteobacteria bacterium]